MIRGVGDGSLVTLYQMLRRGAPMPQPARFDRMCSRPYRDVVASGGDTQGGAVGGHAVLGRVRSAAPISRERATHEDAIPVRGLCTL